MGRVPTCSGKEVPLAGTSPVSLYDYLSVDFLPATISGFFLKLELASGAMAHKSNPYKKVEG